MLGILRLLPQWLCVALTWPVAGVIYALAKTQRTAVLGNLAALRPHRRGLAAFWDSYQVFAQFGLTYVDRLWHLHHDRTISWDIDGMDNFTQLKNQVGGALVYTVHSGNYDIGAGLFAREFGRMVHIVRVPEQQADMQELRSNELRREEQRYPTLRVHYNEDGNHLGLELCRLLQKGEVVAVQGDRVMLAVAPTQIQHGGIDYQIPLGPLVLAELTRVPCYPIFLTRRSALCYHVEFGPPFIVGKELLSQADIAHRWVPIMHSFLQRHWDQWFVFEPLLRPAP
jgi:lauroyl/myristoyl acyltransferase